MIANARDFHPFDLPRYFLLFLEFKNRFITVITKRTKLIIRNIFVNMCQKSIKDIFTNSKLNTAVTIYTSPTAIKNLYLQDIFFIRLNLM